MKQRKQAISAKSRHSLFFHFALWCRYFSLVAKPPRICRSALLTSRTARTDFASSGSMRSTRSVMSLCTVDFEIPNFFAVSLTVALVCIINFATSTALSSIYVFKPSTPLIIAWLCICAYR